MASLGLHVMRFTATEACDQTDAVIEAIRHAARESVLLEDP
jgi:very-short-patch-repair endonuclease